jgi:ribokinase
VRISNARSTICARLPPELTVVGSVNLDLVAKVDRLPRPGETLRASSFDRIPGGKGANQAVAASRLGARVRFVGCVGRDSAAEEALVNLRELDLDVREVDAPTGIAMIVVAADGENEIVVVPGANAEVGKTPDWYKPVGGAVLCQLEIPDRAIEQARANADWLCVNAAPARPLMVAADLVVANRFELDVIGPQAGLVALTLGADGAVLLEDGEQVARATAPSVDAVDGTAAGDAFTACLVVSMLEERDREEALRRACAAGAIAASRFGAQPSLPTAEEIDAILRG